MTLKEKIEFARQSIKTMNERVPEAIVQIKIPEVDVNELLEEAEGVQAKTSEGDSSASFYCIQPVGFSKIVLVSKNLTNPLPTNEKA